MGRPEPGRGAWAAFVWEERAWEKAAWGEVARLETAVEGRGGAVEPQRYGAAAEVATEEPSLRRTAGSLAMMT